MKVIDFILGRKKEEIKVKETCIVIGHKGEVGSAIHQILRKFYWASGYDIKEEMSMYLKEYDFMHVCIPLKSRRLYFRAVSKLIKRFNPKNIIIHSSVLPGATRSLYDKFKIPICYSPIRGQHDSLKKDILSYPKYFSPLPVKQSDVFFRHFQAMGLNATGYNKAPEELELVKLLDVCQYGVLINWAQEAERILNKFGFNYNLLRNFQAEHQDHHPRLRADIFPGVIGGNCVVQDAELIQKIYFSKVLKEMIQSNENKKREERD